MDGRVVPLGYRLDGRKLLVDEGEAATVRLIFSLYLQLGSVRALQRELKWRDIRDPRPGLGFGSGCRRRSSHQRCLTRRPKDNSAAAPHGRTATAASLDQNNSGATNGPEIGARLRRARRTARARCRIVSRSWLSQPRRPASGMAATLSGRPAKTEPRYY